MPNNENNNNLENNNLNQDQQLNLAQKFKPEEPEQKPIIEIPQEYYDKLEKERQEKENKEHQENLKIQQDLANAPKMEGLGSKIIINAVAIPLIIFATLNVNIICIAAIPILFIILSAIFAIKEKKESTYPVSSLIGGMIIAVICFVISMLKDDLGDLMSVYALLSAAAGFIGLISGGIITNVIANREEVKALGTLGAIFFFIALFAGPYIAYQKFPEAISKFLFLKQIEVKAETEDEFIEKTLKNRYNANFTCDHAKKSNSINQRSQRVTNRTCSVQDKKFNVSSIAYNEGDNQYIIADDLIDVLYLKEIKGKLSSDIQTALGATKVDVYLYPQKNCTFVGDCADCDEYYARYAEENDNKNQYKESTELNLEKYLNMDPINFINEYEFKVIIIVNGNFTTTFDYNSVIDKILEVLKNNNLKNTFGFNISLLNYDRTQDFATEVYRVKGDTNSSKEFKDYQEIQLSGSKNNKKS